MSWNAKELAALEQEREERRKRFAQNVHHVSEGIMASAQPRVSEPARRLRNPLGAYNRGYIFWTHVPGAVSDVICYFERWAKELNAGGFPNIPVSHCGVVVGTDQCVEAHWQTGVKLAPLSKYFDDPRTVVVFRRPRGWTPEMGGRIARSAESEIGSKYNVGLIAAQLMANTFVGHYLNAWFHNRPDAWMSRRLDRKNEFICSELAAFALNEQPEFQHRGVLGLPMDTISPQELFEDQIVFEDTKPIQGTRL